MKTEKSCSRWLEAHSNRTAGFVTLPGNALFADVVGDGEYRLIITDLKVLDNRSKLKVYKGILSTDIILPDVPNSLITFYTNLIEPRIPAVAVACGSSVYVYKNNKPYYKFEVPVLPVLPAENKFWKTCNETETFLNIEKALEELKVAPLNLLSGRAQEVVCASTIKCKYLIQQCNKIVEHYKETPITCMSTLRKSSCEKDVISCPIVGTETGHLYILEPQTLTILHQANVYSKEATPIVITTSGLFDVEYRIIIGCREKHICILRKDWLEGKSIIQLINNIVDITVIPGDGFLVVATDDNILSCYTKRGQNLWLIKLENSITCFCLVPLYRLSLNLIAVGLKGGIIHLYHGRHIVDYISVPDTPSAIAFGQLGQEENVMVVITQAGTMTFKILKRTADFNLYMKENIPILQSLPLPLPKRSKWFLEQSLRERNNFVGIHKHFQKDLVNLRLRSVRELVNNTTLRKYRGIADEKNQIKLCAQVVGLGSTFSIILTIENIHPERPLMELIAVLHTESPTFNISSSMIKVPFMPPSSSYKINIHAEETVNKTNTLILASQMTSSSIIKVYIIKRRQVRPIFTATINIPSKIENDNCST